MIKKISIKLILLIFILFIFINPSLNHIFSSKEILYVGGEGDGNFSSIQKAIDSSKNGDRIYVYGGTYDESLVINKSIDIVGENQNKTFLNFKGIFYCIIIKCRNISVSNFTIRDSSIGIYASSDKSNENISIFNMNFYNNTNAILLDSGSNNISIFSNFFKNNTECLRLYNSSDNIIKNNHFEKNEECVKFFDTSKNNLIANNSFLNSFNGLGISLTRWSNNNTILSNNISNGDDGISIDLCSKIKIEGNMIFNNSNKGIYIKDSKYIEIFNNSIIKNGYHGLYIDNFEDYNMTKIQENNLFLDNYQDIKVKPKPPVIKIPSVEMTLLILIVLVSMIVFFLKIRFDKNK